MTENWQIALLSGFLTVLVTIMGFIASSIAGIRKDLREMVRRSECDRAMDTHCRRLDVLEEDLKEIASDVAALTSMSKLGVYDNQHAR